jgi:hypothetical protein
MTWPKGHVIHMTLDHSAAPSISVAHCDCGWEHREPWLKGGGVAQDAAVEAHWSDIDAKMQAGLDLIVGH